MKVFKSLIDISAQTLDDISNANLHVDFLPSHSFHATGKPTFVPEMPRSLSVNCIFDTVWEDKKAVTSFVGHSILAWGTWERRRAVTNKAKRELEGQKERSQPSKAKKVRYTKKQRAAYQESMGNKN